MYRHLLADLRYSLRGLRLRPAFASVIVLTLAFGIGVNVAVFSLYDGLLLRSLPVEDPARLVNLSAPGPKPGSTSCNEAGDCEDVLSYPMFRDLERTAAPFLALAAHRAISANLGFGSETRAARGVLVSGSYFGVLGLAPALGRLLGPADDRVQGEASVAVVSHDFWERELGSDPSAVGRTVVVNGQPLTIVGVAPPRFRGTTTGAPVDVFLPITFRWATRTNQIPNFDDRRFYWAYVFGRLAPGVSREQAAAAIGPVYRGIVNDVEAPLQAGSTEQTLERFRTKELVIEPGARGQSGVRDVARAPLTLLLGATAIVLLIACVNIANLMLARGTGRRGEMAVRASLGAAPARLLGLLSVEALLLAGLAVVLSVPIALGVLEGIGRFMPEGIDNTDALRLHASAAVLAVGVAVLCALVFGVLPALKLARTGAAGALETSGSRSIGGKGSARFRETLTTAQIALSMTLLVLAALFTQSLANIWNIDTGVRAESLVTFTIAPELNGYGEDRLTDLYDRIEAQLAAQPGVRAVASSLVPLLAHSAWNADVAVEGRDVGPDEPSDAQQNFVGAGFVGALGIPLLSGRDFTASDVDGARKVAIVNRELAERYGLGANALGKRVGLRGDGDDSPDLEIVGVIGDVVYDELKQQRRPQVLLPRRQTRPVGFMTFYVRSALPSDEALAMVRRVVATLDPNLPATNVRTFDDQIAQNAALDRLVAVLAAALAAAATLLAALGLYGVLSYTIAQRQREIGLRLALGADGARVRAMVLRRVGWMAGIGVPAGLVAAVLIGLAASSLLFGLAATDFRSLVASLAVLSCVVLGASYFPARRASRVDPVTALRSE